MSASTSCSELLQRLRGWDNEPRLDEVRAVGDACPDDFFRCVVEPLADSFSPRDVKVYERMMRAWLPAPGISPVPPVAPRTTNRVYVLSRVTLGADIKITSVILDAAKKRYPEAEIVFVAGAKSAELFASDPRVRWLEANYPRSGTVAARLDFVQALHLHDGIVIDPDSRFTQLGLALPCDPDAYFHFPSRTYGHDTGDGLGVLADRWMREIFVTGGSQYMALATRVSADPRPRAAVSLGVGGNAAKRMAGGFEADLLRLLSRQYRTIYIDRGAGGEERQRVEQAVAASDVHPVFCEGSFAEFAAVISQCDAYYGYDSAGQHAAAALKIPLTTIFKGAPNDFFRARWKPEGAGPIRCIDADTLSQEEVLQALD